MRKLVDAELFFVDEGASRAYLRSKLGITDQNIEGHHDLPMAKEFHEKFLLAGLDPNDPQFGRPVSAATHKIWHEQKDVAFGGPFNAVWRVFFNNNEDATAQQILAHLQKIRSGHVFQVTLKNGTEKPISFAP